MRYTQPPGPEVEVSMRYTQPGPEVEVSMRYTQPGPEDSVVNPVPIEQSVATDLCTMALGNA